MNNSLPTQKSETTRLATEDQVKYLLGIVKEIMRAKKSGFLLHALMLASSVIEENMLPHLTNMVLSRLELTDKKNILSSDNFAIKNALYFALTQDTDLYLILEKFRKIRNKITHKIFIYYDLDRVNKEAEEGFKCFKSIVEEIGGRLNGKIPIPILTYYPKGWNAALKQVVKIIDET